MVINFQPYSELFLHFPIGFQEIEFEEWKQLSRAFSLSFFHYLPLLICIPVNICYNISINKENKMNIQNKKFPIQLREENSEGEAINIFRFENALEEFKHLLQDLNTAENALEAVQKLEGTVSEQHLNIGIEAMNSLHSTIIEQMHSLINKLAL